jgi:hypothetical protein
VSAPHDEPVPYRVVYSDRVRNELRQLLARATQAGLGRAALDAVRVVDQPLPIYPQFGQPLCDLATSGETLWVAAVWPLVARYVIEEERRVVFVVAPFKPLRHLGL